MTLAAITRKSASEPDHGVWPAGFSAGTTPTIATCRGGFLPSTLAKGARPDPYRVWLSEIMLQQTTVEAVKPYFRKFVEKWPDVAALAAADTEDVMKAWAGLGYYSRARNLKACAGLVAALPGGRFPDTEDGLRKLPGIGPYTAAAIASIAFDRRAAVVDGNVERVMSRLFEIETPLPDLKNEVRDSLAHLVPEARPGDFAQAMMDLGATICTPKRPRCMLCPLRNDCRAIGNGDPERLPIRRPKPEKPLRRGAAFVAVRSDGAILLRKRPGQGPARRNDRGADDAMDRASGRRHHRRRRAFRRRLAARGQHFARLHPFCARTGGFSRRRCRYCRSGRPSLVHTA